VEAADYYFLQLELECKQVLPSGRMAEIECDDPDELGLVQVVRFLDGRDSAVYLRADADLTVSTLMRDASAEEMLSLPEVSEYRGLCLRRLFAGRTGILTGRPGREEYRQVERDGRRWVIRKQGEVVASAVSSRGNERSAELGVETEPAHRHRGYGRQVCAAWAADILASGRAAFYSYQFTNRASAQLARSLDVAWQFETASSTLADSR
jgi:hypothetical protein